MKTITLSIASILLFLTSNAQQDPLMRLFPFQSTWFNPSFAGQHEMNSIHASYRNQYANDNSKSYTGIMSYDRYFSSLNSAIGFIASHDEVGLFKTSEVGLLYSYKLALPNSIELRFGIQASMIRRRIDGDFRSTDPVELDPAIINANDDDLNLDLGMSAKWSGFTFGFAVKHIGSDMDLDKNKDIFYELHEHYYITGMYDWELNDHLSLQPGVLYRAVKQNDLIDFNLTALIHKHYLLGFSYMNSDLNNYNFIAGYQLTKNARFDGWIRTKNQVVFSQQL